MYPDDNALLLSVRRALRSALAITSAEASCRLIRAYQDPPAARPGPDMNVCYYHLQTDSRSPVLREYSLSRAGIPEAASFLPCSLMLVFYGPDCETWAHRCHTFLFLDGPGKPLRILRAAGLFPVPSRALPQVVFEETPAKSFRKRADLVLPARLLTNDGHASVLSPVPQPADTVESPPAVAIHTERSSVHALPESHC